MFAPSVGVSGLAPHSFIQIFAESWADIPGRRFVGRAPYSRVDRDSIYLRHNPSHYILQSYKRVEAEG